MREIRLEMREILDSDAWAWQARWAPTYRAITGPRCMPSFPALCRALGPLLADRLSLLLPCDEVLLGTVTPTGGQGDM